MEQLQEQRQTMNLQEDEIEIDLKEMFFLLLNHWKSIFLAILIGGVLFGAYHALLVRPSYQRRGIGRHLLEICLAQYPHVRQKVLLTDAADRRALDFYRACGWRGAEELGCTALLG